MKQWWPTWQLKQLKPASQTLVFLLPYRFVHYNSRYRVHPHAIYRGRIGFLPITHHYITPIGTFPSNTNDVPARHSFSPSKYSFTFIAHYDKINMTHPTETVTIFEWRWTNFQLEELVLSTLDLCCPKFQQKKSIVCYRHPIGLKGKERERRGKLGENLTIFGYNMDMWNGRAKKHFHYHLWLICVYTVCECLSMRGRERERWIQVVVIVRVCLRLQPMVIHVPLPIIGASIGRRPFQICVQKHNAHFPCTR